jgi:FMN reductase
VHTDANTDPNVSTRLLAVSGSPRSHSKTLLALQTVVEHARATRPGVSAQVLAIADRDVQMCDGRDPAQYAGDTARVIDHVVGADALVFGTPIYRGTYTGLLKNLFDVLPNHALRGKPVGLVATGGSDHHYLAIEHGLKPVVGFFGGYVVPGSVYARNEHFADGALVGQDVREGLGRLAARVTDFAQRVPREVAAAAPLQIPRRSLAES